MNSINRRKFVQRAALAGLTAALPATAMSYAATPNHAKSTFTGVLPFRRIPATDTKLGVLGYNGASLFKRDANDEALLRLLVGKGANYIDTGASSERQLGQLLCATGASAGLFIGSGVSSSGYPCRGADADSLRRSQHAFAKQTLDLLQVRYLQDAENRWPALKAWQAQGAVRHIGVTVSQAHEYARLREFMQRHSPDFVQVNYSLFDRQAEDEILPLAGQLGVAVVVNKPFVTGRLALQGRPVPSLAEETGCRTWKQLSLQYVLANPNVTCVLLDGGDSDEAEALVQIAAGATPSAATMRRLRVAVERRS